MQFNVRQEMSRLTIDLDGRLDEAAACQLREKLMALDTRPYREVDLDIADVSFIGSSGIAKLLLLQNHLAGQKSVLRLTNPPRHIFELFESLRLDKLFSMQRP